MKRGKIISTLVLLPVVFIPASMSAEKPATKDRPARPSKEDLRFTRDGAVVDRSLQSREITPAHARQVEARSAALVEPVRSDRPGGPAKKPTLERVKGAPPTPANPVQAFRRRIGMTEGVASGPGTGSKRASSDGVKEIRARLREAVAQGLDPAVLREARRVGMSQVATDRQAFRPKRMEAAAGVEQRMAPARGRAARKTKLLPLPTSPPTRRAALACSAARQRDIDRLTTAIENADNTPERNRLKLDLAAAHVGAGQWDQAKAIYEELVRTAENQDIRQTAQQNLGIVASKAPAKSAPPKDGPEPHPGAGSPKGGAK